MTIDEAIKYADLMALDMLRMENMSETDTQAFGRMCANALRQVKKMNEENELTKETEKIMKKKDEIEIEKACESLAEMVINALFPEENALHPKKK